MLLSSAARADRFLLSKRTNNQLFYSTFGWRFGQTGILIPCLHKCVAVGRNIAKSFIQQGLTKFIFGFDNNSRAFFSSNNFCLTGFWKHFRVTEKIFRLTWATEKFLWQLTNQPTGRQTKKSRFLFYWTRKPFSFFMWDKFFDRNFFTIWEIISDAEKDEDNFFTFSFFVFIRHFWSDKKNLRTLLGGQRNL